MIYEIHLFAPKTGQLTPSMLEWLFQNGDSEEHPEIFWPVRRIYPKKLARHMLRLDADLIPQRGPNKDVELHYPREDMGIILYIHDRGVIVFFPLEAYQLYSRIVLGICYTYIQYLYRAVGFWSYDPQLDVITIGNNIQSIEAIATLMDQMLPKQLSNKGKPNHEN